MKTSIPRLKTIRPKNGGAAITILRTKEEDEFSQYVRYQVSEMIADADKESPLAGMYILLWDEKGCYADCLAGTENNPIYTVHLPDIINRLITARMR